MVKQCTKPKDLYCTQQNEYLILYRRGVPAIPYDELALILCSIKCVNSCLELHTYGICITRPASLCVALLHLRFALLCCDAI
jgi:hypothetical protein